MPTALLDDPRWSAVLARDASADGTFVFAVVTTGIYCRPSCPARRPRPENVRLFATTKEAEEAGFRACLRCHPKGRATGAELVREACDYIEANLDGPITLAALGEWVGVSPAHLGRTFRAISGISPREYADALRLRRFKDEARAGANVGEASVEAGYGSESRLYARADAALGMTPATYGRGGAGATIRWSVAASDFGAVLVGATERGVCAVILGEDEAGLEARLRAKFPHAEIVRDDAALGGSLHAVLDHLGTGAPLDLATDVRATVFQRRVWDALRRIPRGETRTYAEVAAMLGEPKAVRAVATACASNPVALAVPCHRVVRTDGGLGGYRWGIERKARLLERERNGGD